jgi:glutamate--cysteine ligase
VCRSFVQGRVHELLPLKGGTLYLPEGTSLRMGALGYRSDAQAALAVSYNSLESYAGSLRDALTRPYPAYEAIGVRDGTDNYRQLATSLLQLEAEFYGTVRPKRRVLPGERPLHALLERGVEYVEVRCLDLNPFCPIGIPEATLRFLDVFLLHCVLSESPPDNPEEIAALGRNLNRVATHGRRPGLQLEREGRSVGLSEWGAQVLAECEPIAAALDDAQESDGHRAALADAQSALVDPRTVPSARVIEEMVRHYGSSYTSFVLDYSLRHRRELLALPLAGEVERRFERLAEQSLEEQRTMEALDDVPFETYRQRYLSEGLRLG